MHSCQPLLAVGSETKVPASGAQACRRGQRRNFFARLLACAPFSFSGVSLLRALKALKRGTACRQIPRPHPTPPRDLTPLRNNSVSASRPN